MSISFSRCIFVPVSIGWFLSIVLFIRKNRRKRSSLSALNMKTQVLKIEPSKKTEDIRKVAQLLEQGGIAAIPTETVYGLAARVHPDTLRRLDAVKKRQDGKRYTLHIGDKADLGRYVPRPGAPMRKLTELGWPGPITAIFELDKKSLEHQEHKLGKETTRILYLDGTIGIRCPDFPESSEILKAAFVPIVAPSANPGSQPPAISASQVLDYFDGEIEIIVDGGNDACRYKKSSTVVKYGAEGLEILREGVYGREDIQKMATVRILFVCTGNTCRSPMAEGLCKKILSDKIGCSIDSLANFGYIIESAGVAALEGLAASQEAEVICRQYGISISGHRSRSLNLQKISESDYIFVMSPAHFHACIAMSGGSNRSLYMLDPENEVPDPIGRGLEVYQKCAEQMESAIKERIDEIL